LISTPGKYCDFIRLSHFINREPDSPWDNGFCKSLNARFRDELLNWEMFYTLKEAQIIVEPWRNHYNTIREHGAWGYRPPAPQAIVQIDQRLAMH